MKPLSQTIDLKSTQRSLIIEKWGLTPYQTVWQYQKQLLQERLQNPELPDKLIITEHPAVYTLGTGATLDNLKFDPQNFSGELYRIERGGEVTYHCQGQLVVYPILNLKYYQTDLHWYLRQLEEVIIQLLTNYKIESSRFDDENG